jgi:hypothetical protein
VKNIKRKNNKNHKNTHLYSALLIGIAVVSFWRGAWGLMDLYLFPDNPPLSFIVSLVIGLTILISTHYLIKELTGDR